MIIEDGKGTGVKAKVGQSNRLEVRAVTLPDAVDANLEGLSYNINTGSITFSAAGTLLYIKNNEDLDLVLEAIVLGVGSGSFSDSGELTMVRNPTGGDLISDATAITINQNRNCGSTRTLTADVYKGKSGGTLTGGDDLLFVYNTGSSRSFINVNTIIPKGNSIGIKFDPKLSSGNVKAYLAAVCYLESET